MTPMMMTVPEVAAALKVSLWKAYSLVELRELGHNRIGGTIRVSDAQLAEYLKRTERPPMLKTKAEPSPDLRATYAHLEALRVRYVALTEKRARRAAKRASPKKSLMRSQTSESEQCVELVGVSSVRRRAK
jgi:excisionase family DNA binding protein